MPGTGTEETEETKDTMNPTITIEYNPSPAPVVSGAALRAVQAADREAEAAVANFRAQAARLDAVFQQPEPSAALLAEGFRAWKAFEAAHAAIETLVPRHRTAVKVPLSIPSGPPLAPYTFYILDVLPNAADRYRTRLLAAGIPMPEAGVYTPEYWDDAAARGC